MVYTNLEYMNYVGDDTRDSRHERIFRRKMGNKNNATNFSSDELTTNKPLRQRYSYHLLILK